MSLPVLGLLASRRAPEELLPLLTALTAHCSPQVPDVGSSTPAAALSTDVLLEAPQEIPLAVWVGSPAQLLLGSAPRAAVVLSRDSSVLAAAAERGLFVPVTRAAAGARFLSPFVRRRVRMARSLPSDVVLDSESGHLLWPDRPAPLHDHEIDTALACASSAVVLGATSVLRSLAWGTPTVTDGETASAVGAVPDVHVLVGATADIRRRLARRLAEDEVAAVTLGWTGRLLVEQRHDVDRAALVLAQRLGLARGPAHVQALLAELGTPPGARIQARLADALAFSSSSSSQRRHP